MNGPSLAQRDILYDLKDGGTLEFWHHGAATGRWLTRLRDRKTSRHGNTCHAVIRAGWVSRATQSWRHAIYHISDAGRAAIEETP